MVGASTVATKLIRDALAAEPHVATQTLAKRLYAKHPELWVSCERCRSTIRSLRGANGVDNRKHRARHVAERTFEESEACRRWGALLPEPEQSTWQWYTLPERVARWLVLADMHVPYHDREALAAVLAHADGHCDGVLVLGDAVDAYQLSWWLRDPRRRRFAEEVAAWLRILDAIQQVAGTVVWKAGNHEFRLERYLMAKAPELFGMPQFTWQSFCELEKRGIVWVPENCPIEHHQLSIIHGHEWGARFASPVNPARGAFLKAHECVLEAHGHRTSHHVEPTLRQRPISCWSIGCLCSLHPEYRSLGNKWDHGFAYLDAGSEWKVTTHRIIDGKVV